MRSDFYRGLWRLSDPKISITSAASMAIGAAMAAGGADFSWGWLLILVLAMFCMEVAKNAWGDVYDYDSGTDLAVAKADQTNFSGGKRVLVEELLTRGETWAIAAGFSVIGLALGAMMVFLREPSLFALGFVALVLGWSYHGPPLRFAYRGLGELDVVLIYGPAIAVAAHLLMGGDRVIDVIWASVPLGIFIAAFLWVNEFPDHDADRGAGKNNLVVRLGKQRASRVLPVIYGLGFTLLAFAILAEVLPRWAGLAAIAIFPAGAASVWCWQDPVHFYRHRPAQPAALLAFVLLSAGITVGVLVS